MLAAHLFADLAASDAPMLTLRRSALHSLLLAAARTGEVTLHTGAQFVSRHESATEVTASFADGNTVTADILIGADGLHSRVRACLFGAQPARYAGYTCIRGPQRLPGQSHRADRPHRPPIPPHRRHGRAGQRTAAPNPHPVSPHPYADPRRRQR